MKVGYSIISRGSEKYLNHGYMGVSKIINNKQYLLDIDHNKKETSNLEHSMVFPAKYSIQNIAVSRFELISELAFNRINISDNILILGFGNIGFSCLLNLLKKGYKKISVYSRNKYDISKLENKYKIKIEFVDKITNDYDTYIDTTGNSKVLEDVFCAIKYLKEIVILSTPRDGSFKIDPLIINRKNISIYGCHELNGIDAGEREKSYCNLLEENKSIEDIIESFVNIHEYSNEKLQVLLNKKSNIIDIFQY